MCLLPQLTEQRVLDQLQSAAAVLFPSHEEGELNPTQLACRLGVARSTIYRRASTLGQQLSLVSLLKRQNTTLTSQNAALLKRVEQLEAQLLPYRRGHWVQLTPERLALTTLEMTARKYSISDVQAVLQTAFSLSKPPSCGTLSNIITRGSQLAEQLLDSVTYHYPLAALEFDELFHANSPLLAALEPQSMSLILLEQLGNCQAATWNFAFEYRGIEFPELLVHDCSSQGNLFVRLVGVQNQLCLFHRIRQIGRALNPQIEKLYEKALKEESEELWSALEALESHLKKAGEISHLFDFEQKRVMRFVEGKKQLLEWCQDLRFWLEQLGLDCPPLKGFELRADEYLSHLKRWEKLASEVEFVGPTKESDGFDYLDALACVRLLAEDLEVHYEELLESDNYWSYQDAYLGACQRLRELQAKVKNNGAILKKFETYSANLVRTSSRIEALNRRLRGFTDSKRNVTERQLRLMHLHHNTTVFSDDAKRAGKSPWQWLGFDLPGLEDGFVGVLKAANGNNPWPSPWVLKL